MNEVYFIKNLFIYSYMYKLVYIESLKNSRVNVPFMRVKKKLSMRSMRMLQVPNSHIYF
jgi:hypothetical protein